MNIIVKSFGADRYSCRPDTTWERENKDFFSPGFVNTIYYAPVVFARISKAGKCIGEKFASRYYDGISFGLLMYDGDVLYDGNPDSRAFASILDHSSILPFPLYNPVVAESGDNIYNIRRDSEEIFTTSGSKDDYRCLVEKALGKASGYVSLRIGDMVAAELAAAKRLAGREDGKISLRGEYCENELYRFDIIF